MKCPFCGGKLTTTHTETAGECVIRYRKCAQCGQTVKTIEEIVRPD